jgi:hypothetical protein
MINTKKYILIGIISAGIIGSMYITANKTYVAINNGTQKQNVTAVNSIKETNIAKTIVTQKVVDAPTPVSITTKNTALATIDNAKVFVGHAEFPPEVDSAEGLLSISGNAFVGKVQQRIGFVSLGGYPTTQYFVEVVSIIKGDISKKITLSQGGVGYSPKTGNFYVDDGDIGRIASNKINPEDVYLKTGATYLFVAGYNKKEDRYGISCPPLDRELLTTDNTLSNTQLLTIAENNPRVQEFMKVAGITSLRGAE